MTRPADWWVLDLPGDPTPGDPVRVRSLALSAGRMADDAGEAHRAVRGLASDGAVLSWLGAAGEVFRGALGDFPQVLGTLQDSYEQAADALRWWAGRLDDLQAAADRALAQGRQARADIEALQGQLATARAAASSASAASSRLAQVPAGGPPPDPAQLRAAVRSADAAHDRVGALSGQLSSAQARLDAARSMAEQARELRQSDGRTTARRLHDASDAGDRPALRWSPGDAPGAPVTAASSALALAGLLALGGDVRALLQDPRTTTALHVSALFRDGDAAAAVAALEALSPADAAWVLAQVPADAVDPEYRGLSGPNGALTAAAVLAGLAGATVEFNAAARGDFAKLLGSQALREVGRALATDPAHVTPAQWYGRLDDARRLSDTADDLARSADDLRAGSRSVPVKLGGGLAAVGIGYDIHAGKDPTQAVASGSAGFLASVAAGAATGAVVGTFIPVPGVGTAVGAVVGAGVGIFTSAAVDSLFEQGPDVGAAVDRGAQAVEDTGRALLGAPGALAGAVGGWFD